MKQYLLDTNVVSETRKAKPHGAVLAWLASLPNGHAFVSVVTIGELQKGLEKTRYQDSVKAREIEDWLDRLPDVYQVLPMDTACFREWGRLMNRKPEHLIEDAMIAATARVHDLIVATRNASDFEGFSVKTLNPFQNT